MTSPLAGVEFACASGRTGASTGFDRTVTATVTSRRFEQEKRLLCLGSRCKEDRGRYGRLQSLVEGVAGWRRKDRVEPMHEGMGEEEDPQRVVGEGFDRRETKTSIIRAVYCLNPSKGNEEARAVRDDERDVRIVEAGQS